MAKENGQWCDFIKEHYDEVNNLTKAWNDGKDMKGFTREQISRFMK